MVALGYKFRVHEAKKAGKRVQTMSDDYVRYIEKTRQYYGTEGYAKPYEWAHFDTIPFTPLSKPLSQSRVGLVSTGDISVRAQEGERPQDDREERAVARIYSIPSDTPLKRLYSRNEHYDRYETTLDDVNSYCPLTRLQELAARGRLGSIAPRFHCAETTYSHRVTLERQAPEVLRRLQEDGVDVAVLTPL